MEISGATARCMERHSKVVLEIKAVFVAWTDSYDCLLDMFTILEHSSALEYSIIRCYTNIVYYIIIMLSHLWRTLLL